MLKIIFTSVLYCLAFVPLYGFSDSLLNPIIASSCHCLVQGPAGPQGIPGPEGPVGPTGPIVAPAPAFAFLYNPAIQAGILPGGGTSSIVIMPILAPESSGGFTSSANFGVTIPANGNYVLTYRVFPNVAASFAFYRNGIIIPTTAFGNNSVTSAVNGQNPIVRLLAGDVITLRNINVAGTVSTVLPSGAALSPPIPATMSVLKISD
jgi:hypothetical protein